jgi:hypothetical protein
MKTLPEYINESSYDNAPQRVKYSIDKIEPIVKRILEKRGNKVEKSSRNEDFDGIDLKVINKANKLLYIDVKCCDEKNDSSPNFSFSITNINGKSFKDKKTNYYIFVNFVKNELICISFDNLVSLVDKSKVRRGRGEYVLLNKGEVRKNGYSIFDKEIKR